MSLRRTTRIVALLGVFLWSVSLSTRAADNAATGGIGGLDNGTLQFGDGTGQARLSLFSVDLALVKQARDLSGSVLADAADVVPGQEIWFVLHVDNPTAFPAADVRITDLLDESAFTYVAGSLESTTVPTRIRRCRDLGGRVERRCPTRWARPTTWARPPTPEAGGCRSDRGRRGASAAQRNAPGLRIVPWRRPLPGEGELTCPSSGSASAAQTPTRSLAVRILLVVATALTAIPGLRAAVNREPGIGHLERRGARSHPRSRPAESPGRGRDVGARGDLAEPCGLRKRGQRVRLRHPADHQPGRFRREPDRPHRAARLGRTGDDGGRGRRSAPLAVLFWTPVPGSSAPRCPAA